MTDDLRSMPFRFCFNSDAIIEQAFSRLIHEPWGRSKDEWLPAIDVVESEDEYLIALEIPGVPPEAVEIRAEGGQIIISGQRNIVRVTQSGRMVRTERTQGSFSRTIPLEYPVDIERMQLHSEHGVLYARLPKVTLQEARKSHERSSTTSLTQGH
jgi:HSP20 family protein